MAKILALFNPKAKLFINGRLDLLSKINKAEISNQNPIWFHCSSLGEFEQARNLIDQLKAQGEKILITFFSPSGYEIRKDYDNADWVYYLPSDSRKNAQEFISMTRPKVAVFVKYDLWYFYLKGLQKSETPTFLISALYQSNQIYFKPLIGRLHRKMLGFFDHIYLQDEASQELLSNIGIRSTTVVGDTRVDSVIQRSNGKEKLNHIEQFLGGQKAIILGSIYIKEIEVLAPILTSIQHEKIIIAPHQIDKETILSIRKKLGVDSLLYSELISEVDASSNILIIDNIGTLFNCYQYGKWAFIGGGYKNGLHNTLEPAAYGLPICFGPNYHKFSEAVSMVKNGAAFVIHNSSDLKHLYSRMENDQERKMISQKVSKYIHNSRGATAHILKDILKKIQV